MINKRINNICFMGEFMLKWGMAINPPNAPHALKAIVLLQNV